MNRWLPITILAVAPLALLAAQSPPPQARAQRVPDEVLVQFARSSPSARRAAVLAGENTQEIRRFDALDVHHIRVLAGRSPEQVVAALLRHPEVVAAQPNYIREIGRAAGPPPNDPFWLNGSLWGLERIQAQSAWSGYGAGNGSVVIADIDTGINYNHPDLVANMWHNPGEIPGNGIDDDGNGKVDDVYGIDTYNNDSDPMDDNGHGTWTAGIAAAVGNNGIGVTGVNWNAKILSCKFLNASGSGFDSGAVACLNYILALKQRGINIRVTNNSWGSLRGNGPPATALKNAFDAVGAAGILNVCAAGNDGVNSDATPSDPASFTSSSILSVAASDQNDNRASFSTYGVVSVDLAAPGVSITNTWGGDYGTASGTSASTPFVSGVAALLSSIDPTLSQDNLKVLLMQNVDVLPQWNGLVASGGRLNAFKAAAAIHPVGSAGPSAAFVTIDRTTQGNWPGVYGAAGYSIVSDVTSLPAYATVTPTGQDTWTWAASTTEPRALRRAVGTDRVEATWYKDTQFDIGVTLTDGQPHQVALYCLDWEAAGRSQRFDLYDAATNALLDSRTLNNFSGGAWVVWTVTGNVRFRVTKTGGNNAVVSGVFVGGSGGNQPPTVAISNPAAGATFSSGSPISITATASDPDGTVASVAFYADNQLLSTDTSSPFSYSWTTAATGSHTLTAVATDNNQQSTTSASVTITVTAAGGGTSVMFGGVDFTTRGDWPTVYGTAGYAIVGDLTSLPAYATVTPVGENSWTWTASTADARALRRAGGTGRVAATWYLDTQFDINVALTDAQPHQVAFYCVDWETAGRSQRFDLYDAATNALLDSRTLSSFSGGVWMVWTITGNVRFRITKTGGNNAVVSGVFIGGTAGNQLPTVAISSPAPGTAFASGAPISITATASDPDGTVASVAFYADSQLLNTDTSSPFSFSWTTAAAGSHTLTAVATDNNQQTTTSSPVTISVTGSGGGGSTGVVFVGLDSTTKGDWPTIYGTSGYAIVSDAINLPAYAAITPTGQNIWTWTASTTDPRALRRAVGTDRVAATWYLDSQFDIGVALTDGQSHQVAFYCLDWEAAGRSQRFDLYDAATNALLDSRTLNNFSGGVWMVWMVTGNVRVRVTRLAGNNAVVSGVFIGGTSASGIQPSAISPSSIVFRADFVGTTGPCCNPTSPIVAGSQLLLLQQNGYLYRWNGSAPQQILAVGSAPAGLSPEGPEAIMNAAANAAGTTLFVMFTSTTAPGGIPQLASPRPGADAWQVLYKYDFNGTALSNPQPIVAFGVRTDGHTGGGMVVLQDGSVLFATGDNGDAGEDGRQYAQDASNHLSKILRIDPLTAAVTVLGVGVRNVQRLVINPNGGDPRLEFADIGGYVAEELNSVRIADLLAGPIENFGWGRNAGDNLAREGTFYIDSGGAATGAAPKPEVGFIQPVAQFGREGAQFVAISGPVNSTASFSSITSLFGDLVTGNVFGVIGVPGTPSQTVYRVGLVDGSNTPVTLAGLAGGRPDPRFFIFPDGTAGVLLEATGAFYRLTQIHQ